MKELRDLAIHDVHYPLSDQPKRVDFHPRREKCNLRFWKGLTQAEASA